jgi:D-glycero-beta-D-manno-heptose 1-phosphate adenylyltransferase
MTTGKILSLEDLAERAKALRAAGKKVVATNGCFDLLHVGHVRYLKAARARGDILVVGLNGDASVRQLKGPGRPLESVDLIAIFPEDRATRFIQSVAPDVYVKGGDYKAETLNSEERAVLERLGTKIDLVPFENGYSTSSLLEKLRKK